MISKAATAIWFARRPNFWRHGISLGLRKILPNYDRSDLRQAATDWAAERACSVEEALRALGFAKDIPALDPELLREAEALAKRSPLTMGGSGDLRLLHGAAVLSGATRIVETGVAYGWSSLAFLAALDGRSDARLISVDMPYAKRGNEAYVGIAVPDRFHDGWTLIREPDRRGLDKALALFDGTIDLCHYDSDKSWWGRQYAYPRLWAALRPGGVFISDDIQDNMAFARFIEEKTVPWAVTESAGKYVGIARKA